MLPRLFSLAPQSGALKGCFYNPEHKLPARSKEHLFNACWGGHHKTSQLICDDCNAAFSRIDGALTPWTRFIMNAWQVKGERQKSIPIIPLGGDYDVTAGGKPKLRRPILEVRAEGGGHEISLKSSSKSEGRRILLDGDLEQRIGRGLTNEERERFLAEIRQARAEPEYITGHHRAHLRLDDEYRSVMHTALKCAAMYDPDLAAHAITSAARDYARNGVGSWDQFAVQVDQNVSLLATLRRDFGNLYNATEIYWCRAIGKIIAVVTVLGEIRKSVILGECDCPDAILAVIEPACQAGEVKNVFLQFDHKEPPIPLLEVREFPVTIAMIEREFEVFAGTTLSIDSVVATLYLGLAKLLKTHPEIGPELILQMRQLLAEFVQSIARSAGHTVSIEEVALHLDAAGFAKLEDESGNSTSDGAVQTMVGQAVLSALQRFSPVSPTSGS